MRVAAVWVPDFPLQALRRAVPELAEAPVAVAAGPGPRDRVVAVSAEAAEHGVRRGMTATQARQRSMQVMVRVAPPEVAAAAEAALADAARAVSPRVRRHGPGEVTLDVGGSVLQWGGEAALAEALWRACRRVGLDVRVGLAGSIGVARIAARALPPGSRPSSLDPRLGGWVVVPEGSERAFLAPLPLRLLEPSPPTAEALHRWGIATVGALAGLPRSEVILRLGPEGETLHRLACGDDGRPFIPDPPPESVREGVAFDDPIGALEPFLFVLNGLLGRLAHRLELRGEGFAEVCLELALESGERYQAVVRLVAPTREVVAVLPLLRLRLEASPPGAPVEGVTVTVCPGAVRLVQGHLFGPPAPAPGKLAAALARLAALVGPERVGSPGVADTHEPGRWVVLPFEPPPWEGLSASRSPGGQCPVGGSRRGGQAYGPGSPTLPDARRGRVGEGRVLRAVRPPMPAHVVMAGRRPVAVQAGGLGGTVVALAGPYRTTGNWWNERPFSRDDYDVALADGSLMRLSFDRLARTWAVDGVYD
ncbi:MAG TPA: DNA polymerase Y family protein [Thermoanaerobaculaceae bacterium]|nr:DNA polymerase Y family protein [Thermoanaerobaculaceae bacterium]HRS16296.1 DNA polymerase Y family protein [Thermoanaerobaculaceae bacterium]